MANLRHNTKVSGKRFYIALATQLDGTSIPLNFFSTKLSAGFKQIKASFNATVDIFGSRVRYSNQHRSKANQA